MPIGADEELERGATEEELRSVEGITAPSRRRERLAWRALLRAIVSNPNPTIEYLPSGKPQIKNSQYQHISVSHCQDFVAVTLSMEPCGVDVERLDRRFERVRSRYMSECEALLSSHKDWAAVVWCAKEALYKKAGRDGVDFLRDMQIISAESPAKGECESWHLVAQLFGEQVELSGIPIDENHILVFTL